MGIGQRLARFWERVAAHYNVHLKDDGVARSPKSLEGKWNSIKKETSKFAAAFAAIVGLDESGTTLEDQIKKSLALYKARHPKLEDFQYLECWKLLRDIPRWAELNSAMRKQTPLVDITNDTPIQQASGGVGKAGNVGSGVGQNSSTTPTPVDDTPSKRPQGSKKAKESVKRQKLQDLHFVNQARLSSDLSASIQQKVTFLKEQSMVAMFAMKDDDGRISEEGKEFFRLKRARDLARFKRELEKEEESLNAGLNSTMSWRSMQTPVAARNIYAPSQDICNAEQNVNLDEGEHGAESPYSPSGSPNTTADYSDWDDDF